MVRIINFHFIGLGSIPSRSINMFKWLFYYWLNPTDTPYIESKLNLWSYINIRIFKIKITNQLMYYILSLNNLYIKQLKIFYKNLPFSLFYVKAINVIVISIVLIILFIV